MSSQNLRTVFPQFFLYFKIKLGIITTFCHKHYTKFDLKKKKSWETEGWIVRGIRAHHCKEICNYINYEPGLFLDQSCSLICLKDWPQVPDSNPCNAQNNVFNGVLNLTRLSQLQTIFYTTFYIWTTVPLSNHMFTCLYVFWLSKYKSSCTKNSLNCSGFKFKSKEIKILFNTWWLCA